jgi:hypothetical protein
MARSGIQIGQLQLKNGSLSGSLSSEAYVLQQEYRAEKGLCETKKQYQQRCDPRTENRI